MKRFFETIEFWMACFAPRIFMGMMLLFILLASVDGMQAVIFLILSILLLLIALFYYVNFSGERLKSYEKMLINKAKKSLKLADDVEALVLSKKGPICNTILKKSTRKEYELSLLFLSDGFLTIATGCPKFHLCYYERHGRDKKRAIKDSCGTHKEFRYAFIQSVHYNGSEKALEIILTSGYPEKVSSDKPVADKAIIKIREKLRNSERTIQTNMWNGN